jgi:hypothetical protein
VTGDDDVDSMFQFRLKRRDDETERCRKLQRRQRALLSSMGRKCDMARRHVDVDRMRGGNLEEKKEETMIVGLARI